MDPWDIVTDAECKHEGNIEVQPGRTDDDPVVAYCARCGEPVDMGGMTWYWFKVEADFNRMAADEAATRRT